MGAIAHAIKFFIYRGWLYNLNGRDYRSTPEHFFPFSIYLIRWNNVRILQLCYDEKSADFAGNHPSLKGFYNGAELPEFNYNRQL